MFASVERPIHNLNAGLEDRRKDETNMSASNDWSCYSLAQLNGMIRDVQMYSADERAEISEERTARLLALEDENGSLTVVFD